MIMFHELHLTFDLDSFMRSVQSASSPTWGGLFQHWLTNLYQTTLYDIVVFVCFAVFGIGIGGVVRVVVDLSVDAATGTKDAKKTVEMMVVVLTFLLGGGAGLGGAALFSSIVESDAWPGYVLGLGVGLYFRGKMPERYASRTKQEQIREAREGLVEEALANSLTPSRDSTYRQSMMSAYELVEKPIEEDLDQKTIDEKLQDIDSLAPQVPESDDSRVGE
ncbi:MAG: hypothetical protein AAGI68_14165 [Planctomycetota bacterium]